MLPSLAPKVGGVTGAVVLASGLLLALRRSRRRGSTISATLPRPDEWQAKPLERAIIAAADVFLVRWAGQELADLFSHLEPNTINGAPIAVEPSPAMFEKWTNTSSPPSREIEPKPFSPLKNFTVP